jgi:hypothetical protein
MLLVNWQSVGSPEEHLARSVLPEFATEGARHRDGLKQEVVPSGTYVAAALLARDHEGLAA